MSEAKNCQRCGAPLPPGHDDAKPCPRCLLALGQEAASRTVPTQPGRAPTLDELAPLFENLELEELIGQGGMCAVYRARHKELGRKVALKILTVVDDDPSFDERFAREARAMASLNHPNIVAVHDFGKSGEFTYLMLEFVDGANLRQMIRAGTVQPREALGMVSQVCAALQYAHDKGVVHRDIKPENILVNKAGEVKLVDFGLAKLVGFDEEELGLTGTHQAMGTFHYMAPEQYERPLAVDHRADIYSLGVVFYELLTNELPVGRFSSPSEVVQVDVRLDEVVLRTLEKEPEKRYQRAEMIRSAVDNISNTKLQRTAKPAPRQEAAKQAPLSIGRVLLIILACLLGFSFFFGCFLALLGGLMLPLRAQPDNSGPRVGPALEPFYEAESMEPIRVPLNEDR